MIYFHGVGSFIITMTSDQDGGSGGAWNDWGPKWKGNGGWYASGKEPAKPQPKESKLWAAVKNNNVEEVSRLLNL